MDISLSKAANAYKQASNIGTTAENLADTAAPAGPNFSDMVSEGLENARSTGYKTEAVSTKAIVNKAELTDLVSSVTNAELTLNTVVAVRDKIIGAYQDILRMPI